MTTGTTQLTLTTDGASSNNQSRTDREAGIGCVVSDAMTTVVEQNQYLRQGERYINNLAEYRAVVQGLKWIQQEYDPSSTAIEITSDSTLIVT
jgi:ribonuclease HI